MSLLEHVPSSPRSLLANLPCSPWHYSSDLLHQLLPSEGSTEGGEGSPALPALLREPHSSRSQDLSLEEESGDEDFSLRAHWSVAGFCFTVNSFYFF